MPRSCWAERLGGCSGKLTQEHWLSKGLYAGRPVTMVRSVVGSDDGEWREIQRIGPAPVAGAYVLCDGHHSPLSSLDAEAIHLKTALEEGRRFNESPIIKPSTSVAIDGHLFGRWLCKHYCGAIAAHADAEPHIDFVRYAMGLATERILYFYFPAEVGDDTRIGDSNRTSLQTLHTEDGAAEGFLIHLWGFPTLVINAPEIQSHPGIRAEGRRWLDRVERLQTFSPGVQEGDLRATAHRINLDWAGDPVGSRRVFLP